MKSRFFGICWLLLSCFCLLPVVVTAQKKKIRTLQNTASITVTKVDALSSSARESNPSVSPDGKMLFFTSDRGNQPWTRTDEQGRNDADIWLARRVNGVWQQPSCLDFNTEYGEDDATPTPDGQMLYFRSWRTAWEANGGPYYLAELRGKKWENPIGLGGGITAFFAEMMRDNGGDPQSSAIATDGATVSADGNTFIVACGPNNPKIPMDVYISKKGADGTWGAVNKLPISTPKSERSVFLAADGKTLFFASNGYGGLGGLDIFKTTLNDDGTTGDIVNLGEPFNTKGDDYGFVISSNGNDAYFIRNGDIYYADVSLATVDLKPRSMLTISGTVRDKQNKKPLEASVEISEAGGEESAGPAAPTTITARSNALSGEYSTILKPGKKYIQSVIVNKYKTFTREFEVARSDRDNIVFDIEMEPRPPKPPKVTSATVTAKAGAKGVVAGTGIAPKLHAIFFESDQFSVDEAEYDELDKVMEFFRTNPDYQVEIFGYADDRGSYEYNLRLSQRRVNEVVEYLLSTGVERKQMVLQWFGEEEPIAPNTNDAGRLQNRRVELRFFKKAPDKPVEPVKSTTPAQKKTSVDPKKQVISSPQPVKSEPLKKQ